MHQGNDEVVLLRSAHPQGQVILMGERGPSQISTSHTTEALSPMANQCQFALQRFFRSSISLAVGLVLTVLVLCGEDTEDKLGKLIEERMPGVLAEGESTKLCFFNPSSSFTGDG
mmetsp:Transcript_7130/g.12940  ORF Transcript_7130/g.12940 Transcript_7130/m.12940 type:complete len:115 (+) Transcript_7130:30-374(+)